MVITEKKLVRKRIQKLLRKQEEEIRIQKSLKIWEKLAALPEFHQARTILFYASFDGEVDTFVMMKNSMKLGKRIALPKILLNETTILPTVVCDLDNELEFGIYGIQQPKDENREYLSPQEIDLVVVPGVAFDARNNRIGRGGGYYDRFLRQLPDHVPSIGVAFDFQVIKRLPVQEHDVPVSRVVSN